MSSDDAVRELLNNPPANLEWRTSWLDRLPGILVSAFFRRQNEERFKRDLHGEVHTYSQEHRLKVHILRCTECPSGESQAATSSQSSTPRSVAKKGCVIFLAGGGYLAGGPAQFYPYFKAVSDEFGVVAAGCEYRSLFTHPRHRIPFDAEKDARRCVKFLQDNADELGLDTSRFVLVGASSGGHLASMTALEYEDLGLAGLVLFNPVLDLHFADGYMHRPRMIRWMSSYLQRRYGKEAIGEHSPIHRVRHLPYPTLIMHGTADKLTPLSEAETFKEKLQTYGSPCTLIPFPEGQHRFFNFRVSPMNFSKCLGFLGEFLSTVGVADSTTGLHSTLNPH